jgi:hypothetical protein
MFNAVLVLPLRALSTAWHSARTAYEAMEAIPRIAAALEQLRDASKHVERLATFGAGELPEIVFQLEAVRRQLAQIERRLGAVHADEVGRQNGVPQEPVSPASSRND